MSRTDLAREAYAATHRPLGLAIATKVHRATQDATDGATRLAVVDAAARTVSRAHCLAVEDALRERTDR